MGFFCCVNIRFFGCCGLWFRPYGGSLWQTPQSNQRSGPRRSAPRWGSGFLRSGIHPGASPTVCFAAPPLDACGCAARSLRSHPRINPSTQPAEGAGTSKAVLELTLIVLSGGKRKSRSELFFCGSRPDRRPISVRCSHRGDQRRLGYSRCICSSNASLSCHSWLIQPWNCRRYSPSWS